MAAMKRNRWEDDIQRAVMQYLDLLANTHDLYAFAIPMGGARRRTEAAIMNGTGVKAGVADICVLWRSQLGFPGIGFIEVKTPPALGKQKGYQSAAQKAFEQVCDDLGIPYAIVRSLIDAQEILQQWGVTGDEVAA